MGEWGGAEFATPKHAFWDIVKAGYFPEMKDSGKTFALPPYCL